MLNASPNKVYVLFSLLHNFEGILPECYNIALYKLCLFIYEELAPFLTICKKLESFESQTPRAKLHVGSRVRSGKLITAATTGFTDVAEDLAPWEVSVFARDYLHRRVNHESNKRFEDLIGLLICHLESILWKVEQ